jgi:hypothetical protein
MLPISARTVYIDPEIAKRPNCQHRLERILPHIHCDDIREYDEQALKEINSVGSRRHGKDDFGDDAVLAFTTFDEKRRGWHYNWRDEAVQHGGVCQPGPQLNIVAGCVYRCAYCGFGRRIHFSLDIEQFVDGLDEVFVRHPNSRLYKYSNTTDLPPFEPELDAIPPLVRRFADEPDRYLMLFTKSDQTDFLHDLDHRGHTIISWSLTCDTASRLIDKRTPSLEERIQAMRRAREAGYLVRARLSPVVPISNWQNEYESLFERLYDQVRPDVVTLELLGWMEFSDLTAMFPPGLLDSDALAAAESAADELRDVTWGPFTQQTHEEVYRFCIETSRRISPGTPISVCHGTADTWKSLGSLMEMTPDDYVCNCGPLSAPGGPLYDQFHQPGPNPEVI